MRVKDLIEFLKTQPQDLDVAYRLWSEAMELNLEDIKIVDMCVSRPDGWIAKARPDKPLKTYLVFPGN